MFAAIIVFIIIFIYYCYLLIIIIFFYYYNYFDWYYYIDVNFFLVYLFFGKSMAWISLQLYLVFSFSWFFLFSITRQLFSTNARKWWQLLIYLQKEDSQTISVNITVSHQNASLIAYDVNIEDEEKGFDIVTSSKCTIAISCNHIGMRQLLNKWNRFRLFQTRCHCYLASFFNNYIKIWFINNFVFLCLKCKIVVDYF